MNHKSNKVICVYENGQTYTARNAHVLRNGPYFFQYAKLSGYHDGVSTGSKTSVDIEKAGLAGVVEIRNVDGKSAITAYPIMKRVNVPALIEKALAALK